MKTKPKVERILLLTPGVHELENLCDPGDIKGQVIRGGPNNLKLFACDDMRLVNVNAANPTGKAGVDRHNILCEGCRNITIKGGTFSSKWERGDAINLYNSWDCTIDGVRIAGPLCSDPDVDIARAIAIDGTGNGVPGSGHLVTNLVGKKRIPSMVIAWGWGHRLENVEITGALEITGEAYEGNPARRVGGIELVNVKADELFVHPDVEGVSLWKCKIKTRNYGSNVVELRQHPGKFRKE